MHVDDTRSLTCSPVTSGTGRPGVARLVRLNDRPLRPGCPYSAHTGSGQCSIRSGLRECGPHEATAAADMEAPVSVCTDPDADVDTLFEVEQLPAPVGRFA